MATSHIPARRIYHIVPAAPPSSPSRAVSGAHPISSVSYLKVDLVTILVVGLVPHLEELVPHPGNETYIKAKATFETLDMQVLQNHLKRTRRNSMPGILLSYQYNMIVIPGMSFGAEIHGCMVQYLQRLELGSVICFRHSQPQLPKDALVGIVG